MQKSIDWLELWRELSERQKAHGKRAANKNDEDMWVSRAKLFNADVKRRWATPDSSREFIIAKLKANPDWTALDIGRRDRRAGDADVSARKTGHDC